MKKEKEQRAMQNFATWLEKFMMDHNLKAVQISKASGIHANVISNWRQKHSVPKSYSFVLLASALAYLTEQPRSQILDNMATAILWD